MAFYQFGFALLVVAVVGVDSKSPKPNLDALATYKQSLEVALATCVTKTPTTVDQVGGLCSQMMINPAMLKEKSCEIACVAINMGAMVNNAINVQNIFNIIDQIFPKGGSTIAQYKQAITDCAAQTTALTDKCAVIKKFGKCMVETIQKGMMIPVR